MEQLITPAQLWEGLDLSQPFDESIALSQVEDGISYKHIYFNGMTSEGTTSRVYMALAYRSNSKIKGTVMYVGGLDSAVDCHELAFWANKGYLVASIDYTGSCKGRHTIYPLNMQYATSAGSNLYYIGQSVKQSKLYVYTYNTLRAIKYLSENYSGFTTTIMSHADGSYVALMALAVEPSLDNGTIIMGNLHLDYVSQNVEEDELNHVEALQQEQRWTMALSPQSYVSLIEAPIYVILTGNSRYGDVVANSNAYKRTSDSSRLLVLPNAIDYITDDTLEGVCKWMKGITVDDNVDLTYSIVGDRRLSITVTVNGNVKAEDIALWCCSNSRDSGKHWSTVKLNEGELSNSYTADVKVYDNDTDILALAVVNGEVAISTTIEVVPTEGCHMSAPARLLYRGDLNDNLLAIHTDKWHGEQSGAVSALGYLDIMGTEGTNLGTMAMRDKSIDSTNSDSITLDIVSLATQDIVVQAVCNYPSKERYSAVISLAGDNKWQRVTLESAQFKLENGQPMAADQKVDIFTFSAEKSIIINNIYVV